MIDQARLDAFLTSPVTLKRGLHPSPTEPDEVPEFACATEIVSWLAKEKWSDHPACASPVLAAAMRSRNDRIGDDLTRTAMLKPLVPLLVGTCRDRTQEVARAYAILDWSVRDRVPALLDALGQVDDAAALRALARIGSTETANAARGVAQEIRERHRAKYEAATDALAYASYAAYAATDALAYASYAAYAATDPLAYASDAAIPSLHERIASVVTETNRSFVGLIQRLALP